MKVSGPMADVNVLNASDRLIVVTDSAGHELRCEARSITAIDSAALDAIRAVPNNELLFQPQADPPGSAPWAKLAVLP
jgi:hypothetical protein